MLDDDDDEKFVSNHDDSSPLSDSTDSDTAEYDDKQIRRVESDDTARVENAENVDSNDRDDVDDDNNSEIRDHEHTGAEAPLRVLSISVDEDNLQNLGMNQLPVKMSFSLGNADKSADEDEISSEAPE